jgi:hypothetical protein
MPSETTYRSLSGNPPTVPGQIVDQQDIVDPAAVNTTTAAARHAASARISASVGCAGFGGSW